MKNNRQHYLVLALAAISLLWTAQDLGAQKAGETAPDFAVELAGGGEYKLSDQRGKVVMVFMFGNTCPYCIASGPTIESAIYQQYKDNPDFTAVGLDVWDGSEASVNGFAASTGITFPLGIKGGFVENAWDSNYDRLHVVDQDGILVFKGSQRSNGQIEETVQAIEQALMTLSSGSPDGADPGVEISVFPVPASDHIRFSAGNPVAGIGIYDLTGKPVLSKRYDGTPRRERSLDIGHLPEGLYFYSLDSGGAAITGKFLIQR